MTKLPTDFPAVIRTQAEKVTKNATSDFDKAVALQDWFRTGGGFTYSLDQRAGSGMDLLAHFVTDDRVGYCEQFASAMAAMGRSLGIPSRVVVGFLDGQPLPDGRILYTSDERHAWPEMYFPGSGWVRFEPTPAQRAAYVPPYTQSQAATQAADPGPDDGAEEGPRCQARRRTPGRHLEEQLVVLGAVGARGRRAGPGAAADRAGCAATDPAPAPAARAGSGAPGRGSLGRAGRDRPGPRPGLARAPLPPRAGRAGHRPGRRPDPTRSRPSRGCSARSSAAATPRRPPSPRSSPRTAPAPCRPWTRGGTRWAPASSTRGGRGCGRGRCGGAAESAAHAGGSAGQWFRDRPRGDGVPSAAPCAA